MKKTETAKTIDEALEQFERMIKELIDLGYSPDMAVRVAYKSYPIMKLLEAPLTADMVQNFNTAYHGVLPIVQRAICLLITLHSQLARLCKRLGRATD